MYKQGFNYIDFVNRVENILELIESKPNNFKHIFTELFDKDFKSQLTFIEKLNNGASLIQIYTGLIFRGHGLVNELRKATR